MQVSSMQANALTIVLLLWHFFFFLFLFLGFVVVVVFDQTLQYSGLLLTLHQGLFLTGFKGSYGIPEIKSFDHIKGKCSISLLFL